MLFTLGLQENCKNILSLAHPFYSNVDASRRESVLRAAYHAFLRKVQPAVPLVGVNGPEMAPGPEPLDTLIAIFDDGDGDLTDMQHHLAGQGKYPFAESQLLLRRVQVILQKNPEFSWLFNLVVHTLIHVPSADAGGGTISSAVGVIWLNPRARWSDEDLYEALIHETTHNLLFLDERVHKHYKDAYALARPENKCLSAILKTQRPLDKVLHSLVVAAEVLAHRIAILGDSWSPVLHPPTARLMAQIRETVASLRSSAGVQDILTERGHYLVNRSEEIMLDVEAGQELPDCDNVFVQ